MTAEQKAELITMINSLIEKISERAGISLNTFVLDVTSSDSDQLAIGVLIGVCKKIANDHIFKESHLGIWAFATECAFDRDIKDAIWEIEEKYADYR